MYSLIGISIGVMWIGYEVFNYLNGVPTTIETIYEIGSTMLNSGVPGVEQAPAAEVVEPLVVERTQEVVEPAQQAQEEPGAIGEEERVSLWERIKGFFWLQNWFHRGKKKVSKTFVEEVKTKKSKINFKNNQERRDKDLKKPSNNTFADLKDINDVNKETKEDLADNKINNSRGEDPHKGKKEYKESAFFPKLKSGITINPSSKNLGKYVKAPLKKTKRLKNFSDLKNHSGITIMGEAKEDFDNEDSGNIAEYKFKGLNKFIDNILTSEEVNDEINRDSIQAKINLNDYKKGLKNKLYDDAEMVFLEEEIKQSKVYFNFKESIKEAKIICVSEKEATSSSKSKEDSDNEDRGNILGYPFKGLSSFIDNVLIKSNKKEYLATKLNIVDYKKGLKNNTYEEEELLFLEHKIRVSQANTDFKETIKVRKKFKEKKIIKLNSEIEEE